MCSFTHTEMESTNERQDGDSHTAETNQFKLKRKLMTKFFNEPVDALDLRLAKAEENLSELPVDPFIEVN